METWTQQDMREYIRSGQAPVRSKSVQRRELIQGRIEITLPLPPPEMHPNARKHWRTKLNAKKQQRRDAMSAAAIATVHNRPEWSMAEIHSTWYLARRNDSDNLIAWGKATWDGLADAGIVNNDRGFVFMPPKQITGKAANGERKVVLVISERRA